MNLWLIAGSIETPERDVGVGWGNLTDESKGQRGLAVVVGASGLYNVTAGREGSTSPVGVDLPPQA